MRKKERIVLIEDDKILAKTLASALTSNNYKVKTYFKGEDGLNELLKDCHALAIVDINLPLINGLDIVSQLRKSGSRSPVIIITGLGFSDSEIKSYKHGASIFHKKPLDLELLLTQMESLLDIHRGCPEIEVGDLLIKQDKRSVSKKGSKISLSPKEYSLLLVLVLGEGKVFSRDTLLAKTHSPFGDYEIGSIDTLISRIRKKIGTYQGEEIIETMFKVGYKINANCFKRQD